MRAVVLIILSVERHFRAGGDKRYFETASTPPTSSPNVKNMASLSEVDAALNGLQNAALVELGSLVKPPPVVGTVGAAVCMLLGLKPPRTNKGDYWPILKDRFRRTQSCAEFVQTLLEFDAGGVPAAQAARVAKLVGGLTVDQVAKASRAATVLFKWVVAVLAIHDGPTPEKTLYSAASSAASSAAPEASAPKVPPKQPTPPAGDPGNAFRRSAPAAFSVAPPCPQPAVGAPGGGGDSEGVAALRAEVAALRREVIALRGEVSALGCWGGRDGGGSGSGGGNGGGGGSSGERNSNSGGSGAASSYYTEWAGTSQRAGFGGCGRFVAKRKAGPLATWCGSCGNHKSTHA